MAIFISRTILEQQIGVIDQATGTMYTTVPLQISRSILNGDRFSSIPSAIYNAKVHSIHLTSKKQFKATFKISNKVPSELLLDPSRLANLSVKVPITPSAINKYFKRFEIITDAINITAVGKSRDGRAVAAILAVPVISPNGVDTLNIEVSDSRIAEDIILSKELYKYIKYIRQPVSIIRDIPIVDHSLNNIGPLAEIYPNMFEQHGYCYSSTLLMNKLSAFNPGTYLSLQSLVDHGVLYARSTSELAAMDMAARLASTFPCIFSTRAKMKLVAVATRGMLSSGKTFPVPGIPAIPAAMCKALEEKIYSYSGLLFTHTIIRSNSGDTLFGVAEITLNTKNVEEVKENIQKKEGVCIL